MKYKILKGSKTFEELNSLHQRMTECNLAATALAKELGGTDKILFGGRRIAGGLEGIWFETKPEFWKLTHRDWHNFFCPKICKQTEDVRERINALPEVKYEDLNKIVGFKYQVVNLTWHNIPGVVWGDDLCLLNVDSNCEFTPNGDMVEILDSEYKQIEKELVAAHKKENGSTKV